MAVRRIRQSTGTMALQVEVPPRIVIDAGPLIGAFNARDRFHGESSRGLEALVHSRSRILVPMPVVFEVFKWLAYNVDAASARTALSHIRVDFETVEVNHRMLDELAEMVDGMPRWPGSLEDALLALIGGRMNVPVWTFNYRDLRAFRNLQFWTPA
jgi:predicted nucleic acid-binding protein